MDTPTKRFSMVGVDAPWPLALMPPSGTIGAAPRQALLRKYAGILFASPSGATFKAAWATMANIILQSRLVR
jgi:hypothetical protein